MSHIGIKMKVVQELLEHQDFAITANIYSHTSEDAKVDADNKLSDSIQNQEVSPPEDKFLWQSNLSLIQFVPSFTFAGA